MPTPTSSRYFIRLAARKFRWWCAVCRVSGIGRISPHLQTDAHRRAILAVERALLAQGADQ
jgi:hypothetical protein